MTCRRPSGAFPAIGRADRFGVSLNGHHVQLPGYELADVRAGVWSTDGWGASSIASHLFNKPVLSGNLDQETLLNAAFNRIGANQPFAPGFDLTHRF